MEHIEEAETLRNEIQQYIDRMSIPQLRLVLSFLKNLFNF